MTWFEYNSSYQNSNLSRRCTSLASSSSQLDLSVAAGAADDGEPATVHVTVVAVDVQETYWDNLNKALPAG